MRVFSGTHFVVRPWSSACVSVVRCADAIQKSLQNMAFKPLYAAFMAKEQQLRNLIVIS